MESTKIVWHDPRIFGPENSNYIREYLSPLQYNAFTTVLETVQFLSGTTDKWILVTSGTNGKELVQQVHDFPSVIGIVIFCMNYNYHKQWSSAFNKVKRVETQSFQKVVEQARKFWDQWVTINALNMTPKGKKGYDSIINALEMTTTGTSSGSMVCDSSTNRAYYHMEKELEMSFLQICKLSLKNNTISRSVVLNELKSFAKTDADKVRVEEAFGKYPDKLLRSFVYVYTTNLIFQNLNECYAKNDYSRVMNITAACLLELKSNPQLMLQNPTVLYRGVNISKEECEKLTVGSKGFWPAFTSASIKEEVARRLYFKATVIFDIHLQANGPHPHILVQSWSEYISEEEVLLLPYFPLVITNIRKEDNVTLITVEQDSSHPSLAINSNILINYWKQRIEIEFMTPIDRICDEIMEKILNSVNLPEYFMGTLSSENSDSSFVKDFEETIRKTYNKHESEIQKLNNSSSGSLLDYVKIMKEDLENSIISDIKKMIERIFNSYFEKIQSNIIKIMSYEVITTFDISDSMLKILISKIIRKASTCNFSAASAVKKEIHEECKGEVEPSKYLDNFIKEMIKAMKCALLNYHGEIEQKNDEIKNELCKQLIALKNKIHQSLENVLL